MGSRSITDADFYTYLVGRDVIVEWCDREIKGEVVEVEAVTGFNISDIIDIRVQIAEGGPHITVAPEDIRRALIRTDPDR